MELVSSSTVVAIQDALAPVAEKIGEGAGYAWEVVVWGQVAEGIADIFVGIPLVLLMFFGFWLTYKYMDETDGAILLVNIPTIIAGVAGMCMISEGIIALIAPEYTAIKMLIGITTGV